MVSLVKCIKKPCGRLIQMKRFQTVTLDSKDTSWSVMQCFSCMLLPPCGDQRWRIQHHMQVFAAWMDLKVIEEISHSSVGKLPNLTALKRTKSKQRYKDYSGFLSFSFIWVHVMAFVSIMWLKIITTLPATCSFFSLSTPHPCYYCSPEAMLIDLLCLAFPSS